MRPRDPEKAQSRAWGALFSRARASMVKRGTAVPLSPVLGLRGWLGNQEMSLASRGEGAAGEGYICSLIRKSSLPVLNHPFITSLHKKLNLAIKAIEAMLLERQSQTSYGKQKIISFQSTFQMFIL